MGTKKMNKNKSSKVKFYSSQTNKGESTDEFNQFPFTRTYLDFVNKNLGKELFLVLGIGTSGSRDVRNVGQFVEKQLIMSNNKAFFLLMVDPEYTNKMELDSSLKPLLEMGYEHKGTNIAVHHNGTIVYLWGKELPTAYQPMEKYLELRDDLAGAYNYGKRCILTETTKKFYESLLSFLEVPLFQRIYVYNQGFYNNSNARLGYNGNKFFLGPSFREQRRIKIETPNEMASRPATFMPRIISVGEYFENFCELLYCLYRSGKPVFLLKEPREGGLLQISNMQGGSKKRKTRKFQKSRRRTE